MTTPTLASTIANLDELAAKVRDAKWATDKTGVFHAATGKRIANVNRADESEFIAALRNAWPEIRKALDEKGAEHATD